MSSWEVLGSLSLKTTGKTCSCLRCQWGSQKVVRSQEMLWWFSSRPWIGWPGCCENMDYQARCYECSESCVLIFGIKSTIFSVGVGLCWGCFLSLILFMVFMNKILRCSKGQECVQLEDNFRTTAFCRWCGFCQAMAFSMHWKGSDLSVMKINSLESKATVLRQKQ